MLPSSSITDTVMDVLQARVTHASTLVNLATITVALGVAFEGVDLLYDTVAWVKRKRRENRERSEFRELALISPVGEIKIVGESHSDHPKWVKRTLRLGLLLVVAGVVGEWRCGAELEHAHDAVHKYDLAKLTEADQKAGKAADSAKTAHDEVVAVGKEADAIDKRLGVASAQLSDLEKDIVAQGPRWRLIDKAAPELIKQLAPFAGQKVDLIICGVPNAPRSLQNEETTNTWGSIARILEEKKPKGANWSALHGGLTFWLGTLGCAGIHEFVSSEAPQKTMEAAKALGAGLAKALPPSADKMPGIIDANSSRAAIKMGFESEDAPWHLVTKHPDEIVVWIGPHP
jgi:hypothetical protein